MNAAAPRLATSHGRRLPHEPEPETIRLFPVELTAAELAALARHIAAEAATARADGDTAAADRLDGRAADLRGATGRGGWGAVQ